MSERKCSLDYKSYQWNGSLQELDRAFGKPVKDESNALLIGEGLFTLFFGMLSTICFWDPN
jgi:hypothetical protein